MAELNREEFLRLQRDAERRLREMQKKSEELLGNAPAAPDFVKIREKESNIEPNLSAVRGREILNNISGAKNLSLDRERALLLMIILLLSGENADELLILALIYIML